MISIRRVSLGGGFRYLMESVAAGDKGSRPADGLAAYYAATGTPPGRFLGAGLADLDGGNGVAVGSLVSEEHLRQMLGEVCDPVSGEPVGQTPILSEKRVPVAGFDLTFSPSKSVSVAWALADPDTKAVIYNCHLAAIDYVLGYVERDVFHSRSGPQGCIEEPITGVIAAAFTHWDSRAGDPQLHDHVVIWNRARSVSDGKWRTLDSRAIFTAAVTLSELHQGVLSDLLTDALGVGWEAHERRHSNHRRYEISGVPAALMSEFSTRTEQVEQRTTELVDRFVAAHGRRPSAPEAMRLAQRATVETRPVKTQRSLDEMTSEWRNRAEPHLGSATAQMAWVTSLAGRNDLPVLRSGDLAEAILADAARVAMHAVADRKATFGPHNIMAEALRILHGVRFATPDDRLATAERITSLALEQSLLLTPDTATPASHRIFTTEEILNAETRLLDASRRLAGPAVGQDAVAAVVDQPLKGGGPKLSRDQAAAITQIATSGYCLDLLIGPAGTGKSTAMAALRAAWETRYGPGSVIGLAPSAAAAETLAAELGIDTENTAKWLTEGRRVPDLVGRRQRLAATLNAHTGTPHALANLRQQFEALDNQIVRRTPQMGQLFILDEASLAGTLALDELVAAATAAGAKVVLVGDPHQLSAVEAGGAFSFLATYRGDQAVELRDVHRFTHPWEKAASLELRSGNPNAINTYHANGRIHGGTRQEALEALYQAWKADTAAGLNSLMIAPDHTTVTYLNRRARTDRITAGAVQTNGLQAADNQTISAGDNIITRRNDRRLTTSQGWVKNGDRWTVTAIHRNGSITATQAGANEHVTLPATYITDHVELGYATTTHQAQGRTVDTAHAYINPTHTRETLYVAATRGRYTNKLYVDTAYDPDPDTGHQQTHSRPEATQVLNEVLARQAAEQSAHQTLVQKQHGGVRQPTTAPSESAVHSPTHNGITPAI